MRAHKSTDRGRALAAASLYGPPRAEVFSALPVPTRIAAILGLITLLCVVTVPSDLALAATPQSAPPSAAVRAVSRWPTAVRPLRGLDFISATTGWATGSNGVVIRSVTRGALWTRQRSGGPGTANLNDVCFVDAMQGWAVGQGGLILHTVDAGRTWTVQPTGTEQPLLSVKFLDVLHGWAVGGRPDGQARAGMGLTYVLLATADGGSSWATIDEGQGRTYRAVDFVDRREGWIVGQRLLETGASGPLAVAMVLRTSDGGLTWSAPPVPAALGLSDTAASCLLALDFRTPLIGWATGSFGLGEEQRGLVLRTVDGGHTWRRAVSSQFTRFTDVCFSTSRVGYAIGHGRPASQPGRRQVIKTVDGGQRWSRQSLPAHVDGYASLDFVSAKRGWIAGDTTAHRGIVLRTVNGGANWMRVR